MNPTKPIRELFLQGTSPSKIAWCVACGITLAVFPVVGTTTLLCTVVAMSLGLNLPAIQAVNYLAAPLQLALLLPLMRMGDLLFGAPRSSLSAERVLTMIRQHPGSAITALGLSTLHAVVAWLLLAPLAFVFLYFPTNHAFKRLAIVYTRVGQSSLAGGVSR